MSIAAAAFAMLESVRTVACDGYEPRKDVSSRHMMYRSAARYCLACCWFGWVGGGRVGCGCQGLLPEIYPTPDTR
eukprot:scaffold57877_cov41-Cyclotella_meneghiniana.AAC.8